MDNLHDEPIDSRIGVHSSDHVELKLDYTIRPGRTRTRYRVESYFFIPRSLGIHRETYSAREFYADIKANIRFKTPSLSLAELSRSDSPLSPLARIDDMANQLSPSTRGNRLRIRRLCDQLRLFGCITWAKVRDSERDIEALLRQQRRRGGGDFSALNADIELLLDGLAAVIRAWRSRAAVLNAPGMSQPVVEAYLYVDEYLSLIVEGRLTELMRALDGKKKGERRCPTELKSLREALQGAILEEREYRKRIDYPTHISSDHEREYFVYRLSMLKKFVMSVLWLDVQKERDGRRIGNLLGAIAAGVAMFVALIVTVVQSRWLAINTWGFITAATVTYMLKDRIKEWLKNYFSNRLMRWISDYSVRISDPITGASIGRCREAFSYISADSVPVSVMALRHHDAKASIETLAKPEVVIRYEKDVRLNGNEIIHRLPVELYEVNDIIRFSLGQMIARADDPVRSLPFYDRVQDAVVLQRLPKVYHLNMVIVMSAVSAHMEPVLRRVRVVFDKRGIRRVDTVY